MQRTPLDGAIARRAGQLRQQFGLEKLSLPDAAIAASADLSGCTLLRSTASEAVTCNTRDFAALADVLAIEFYSNEE